LDQRIRTYWGIDQGDSARLGDIVHAEFQGPPWFGHWRRLSYERFDQKELRNTLSITSAGGLYVIEDWAWGHWPEFQTPNHPWSYQIPLTGLIFELVAATGGWQEHLLSEPLISNLSVFQEFAVVERGEAPLREASEFKIEKMISGCGITPEARSKVSKVLRNLKGCAS
jgi:hypothetical protein